MYCKKCGTQIDDDSDFCYKCGAKINYTQTTTNKNNYENTKNESVNNRKSLKIAIILILFVVCATIATMAVINRKHDVSANNNNNEIIIPTEPQLIATLSENTISDNGSDITINCTNQKITIKTNSDSWFEFLWDLSEYDFKGYNSYILVFENLTLSNSENNSCASIRIDYTDSSYRYSQYYNTSTQCFEKTNHTYRYTYFGNSNYESYSLKFNFSHPRVESATNKFMYFRISNLKKNSTISFDSLKIFELPPGYEYEKDLRQANNNDLDITYQETQSKIMTYYITAKRDITDLVILTVEYDSDGNKKRSITHAIGDIKKGEQKIITLDCSNYTNNEWNSIESIHVIVENGKTSKITTIPVID